MGIGVEVVDQTLDNINMWCTRYGICRAKAQIAELGRGPVSTTI